MAGGKAAVVAGCGLMLVGCWKDNPAFMVTEGPGEGSGDVETTAGPPIDEPESTGEATSEATTTAGLQPIPSTSTTGTTSGAGTSGPDTTTTTSDGSTSSTGDDPSTGPSTSTTGEDLAPACGTTGFGPAELRARQWNGLIAQACNDIPGRNYRVLEVAGVFVTAVPCSSNPAAGCTGCDYGKTLLFGFTTPAPNGVLALSKCVYLSAHGAIETPAPEPCRYRQMALWWDGSNTPAKQAPLAIFGHDTLSVDPSVADVSGDDLGVGLVPADAACGCVDADDCCPDKAVEYDLRFEGEEPVEVPQGMSGVVKLAGATYEAYNGQSFETGACGQEQRFDWWLLRE
ncbi:hypothetical protein SAMN02745121_04697 [Nannocystis exedens]|uniref:Uncharacterized protein n=1 Tax=Nannocystis exedens TaxID=54 RepID=A0A1I2BJA2_9BACT|nr:hypothetical protein [Nannocystis exedens]PCC67960.1 hypothetical protein NAEX_00968 [Nannocystis exedens]SFE55898.1 hypothetical protein SAMN02745121_04697 [Nannocystis exedens]